jgi:hypothetical protein
VIVNKWFGRMSRHWEAGMRYHIFGRDRESGQPVDPFVVEAEDEQDAKNRAQEMGTAVEKVEAASEKVEAAPPIERTTFHRGSDHPIASALVVIFRLLAVLFAILHLILLGIATNVAARTETSVSGAALTTILQGILIVSGFLAVGEVLRLGIAIERNTRGREVLAKREPKQPPR